MPRSRLLPHFDPSARAFRPGEKVSHAASFRWLVMLVLTTLLLVPGARISVAQDSDDPLRFAAWLGQDFRAFPRALVRAPSPTFGAGVLAVGILSYRDASLAGSMQKWHRRELWRVVEEFGDANAMRPASIIIFAGALLQDDHRVQDAAFTGLEALILANLLTNALKAAFGRSRPWQEPGADDWEPFSGSTSFPSGHATTAFALMTPWVMYFRHPLAWTAIGLATATSLSRVTLRYHWPSDVLAGAIVGSSISVWLSRRHMQAGAGSGFIRSESSSRLQVRPILSPFRTGVRLSF